VHALVELGERPCCGAGRVVAAHEEAGQHVDPRERLE